MKKILVALMIFICMSCMSYTAYQDDLYGEGIQTNVSFSTVVRLGTPYYHNGRILYYQYQGAYYYPYFYDNYWYVRAYKRPVIIDRYPKFRPNRYDHRLNPNIRRPNNRVPDRIPPNNKFGNGRRK